MRRRRSTWRRCAARLSVHRLNRTARGRPSIEVEAYNRWRRGAAEVGMEEASAGATRRARRRGCVRVLVGLGLVAAVAAAIAFVATRPQSRQRAPGAALRSSAIAANRLAVLPFENLSPDPANAFFADGIHEELLSALGSRAQTLEVISRTTMMQYRGQADVGAGIGAGTGSDLCARGQRPSRGEYGARDATARRCSRGPAGLVAQLPARRLSTP